MASKLTNKTTSTPHTIVEPDVACPACKDKRLHNAQDWRMFHPWKGHGYTKEQGQTRPNYTSENTDAK